MEYKHTTLEQYLNENTPSYICKSADQITKDIKDKIFINCNKDDLYTPLEKGKEWLYELTLKYQPKTGKLLLSGGELYFSAHYLENGLKNGSVLIYLMQEVEGKLICIHRNFYGLNPSDDLYQQNKRSKERIESLPKELQYAYYYRFDGLNIPSAPNFSYHTRLLPFPIDRPWESIDGYLAGLKLKKKYLPLFEERFPGIRPKNLKLEVYTNFMMFLDTRTVSAKSGDVFFVKTHIRDGIIYYIRDADMENMYILSNPIEAIDSYCEHVLLSKKGRFDFLPYSTPFKMS